MDGRLDNKVMGKGPGGGWLTLTIVLLGLFKFFLVSNEDILRQAWDPGQYANMITNRVWFGEYDNLVYRPGTALAAMACRMLGIPYRFGLELAFLVASFLGARALFSLTRSRLLYLATFVLLAFHPWSFHYFRFLRCEPPFMIAGLLVLTGLVTLLQKRRIDFFGPPLLLTGLALAIWDSFRMETALVLATYLMGSLAILVRPGSTWARWRREILALTIPPLLLFATQHTIKFCNYLRTDVYTLSAHETPGYTGLMDALYRIDTPEAILHAPVTRTSLSAACRVSPTLNRFRDKLLDSILPDVRTGAMKAGQVGKGGLILNWEIHCSIQGRDLAETNLLMENAAKEINAALADGRLPRRAASFPIDPNYGIWIPQLPRALLTNLGDLFSLPEWKAMGDDNPKSRFHHRGVSGDLHQFDLAAGRRAVKADRTTVVLEGFVACHNGEARFVALEDASGTVLGVCSPRTQPVSLPSLPVEGKPGTSPRLHPLFNLITEVSTTENLALSIWQEERCMSRVPLAGLPMGLSQHPTIDGKGSVHLDLWRCYTSPPQEGFLWPAVALPWVTRLYPVALVGLLLGLFLTGYGRRDLASRWVMTLCLASLTGAVIFRIGAYTLMLATLGWRDPRYMQCFTPLVILPALVAALWLGVRVGVHVRRPGKKPSPTTEGS